MDWPTYWTILAQIVIALVVLMFPLNFFFLLVFSGIERGLSKPPAKRKQDEAKL